MDELEKIIEKYFQKETNGIVYYNLDQNVFDKVIKNIGKYERPDILSIFDNKIVAIEHFEFDRFKNNKKGSDFKVQDFKIKKRFDEAMKEELKQKESVIVHDKIEGESSAKNYFKNFIKVFQSHYQNIEDYLEHIQSDFDCSNEEIHICFFAEDVSPLGSNFTDAECNIHLLLPIYSDKVIELLNNSPKVEYLIVGTYAMSEYKMVIIENKKEVLERFKAEHNNFNEEKFINFNPVSTGFAFKVPKDGSEQYNYKI